MQKSENLLSFFISLHRLRISFFIAEINQTSRAQLKFNESERGAAARSVALQFIQLLYELLVY
jgi:hypothetical protein